MVEPGELTEPSADEPEARGEAAEGLVTALMLIAVTGVAMVFGAAFLLSGSRGLAPPPHAGQVIAVFVLCALGPAAVVAWIRHRARRRERGRAAPSATALRLQARVGPSTCPFCRDALGAGDLAAGVVRCPGCEVAHHAACWRDHEGCSTLGCRRDPRARDAAAERDKT